MTQNELRAARRAAGLCRDCGLPAVPERARCARHLRVNAALTARGREPDKCVGDRRYVRSEAAEEPVAPAVTDAELLAEREERRQRREAAQSRRSWAH